MTHFMLIKHTHCLFLIYIKYLFQSSNLALKLCFLCRYGLHQEAAVVWLGG